MIAARVLHFLTLAHFRHGDIPPGIARRPLMGMGVDRDDIGAIGILRAPECSLQIADRLHLFALSAHRPGVCHEVDSDLVFDPAVLDQVVEGCRPLEVLQAVDHGKAAIVADHDDQLLAGEHG